MSLPQNEISAAALIERLAAGHAARITVVTPNRRLAQALQARFGAARERAGETAWETPDVLPFGAFVARLWDDALHSDLGPGLPSPLSPAQEHALWEEAIAASRLATDLLAAGAAATQCAAAWALVHAWRLRDRLEPHAGGEDARAFLDWAQRYERLARGREAIDAARLPDAVAPLLAEPAIELPATLVLFGFDLLTPQQEAFVASLAATGVAVARSRNEERPGRVRRLELATEDEEFAAVARWARARLEADQAARIGIVVPDLARSRARIARALARTLHPARPLEAGGESPVAFDISLGMPLDAQPLVHDALLLLRLCGRALATEEASRLLRSPYLAGAAGEAAARARLDAALRERLGVTVTLDALARAAQWERLPRAPGLAARLERLAQHRREALFAPRAPGEWARAFAETLRIAGFAAGCALESAEHQALEKWHEVLGDFAGLERVCGRMGFGEASAHLARIARDTLFQPESPEVPVQVLGILESSGLAFDHLWVTGLTEEAWPLPARPHPFVPLRLQREAGIPNAEPAASLALDRRITAAWRGSAGEVVFSHARTKQESECAASPLVAGIAAGSLEELALPAWPLLADAVRAAGRIERRADGRAPALPPGERRGGTALFRDQAACPFRAFARHRLGSEGLAAPQPGLGAADRGTLLHETMRGAWARLGSKAGLDACTGEALEALLDACAADAIELVRRTRREALSGRFAEVERRRLAALARDWLAIERQRGDFEVAQLEARVALAFGGVAVSGKLDRLDRLAAGGEAVIDYKSGAAAVSSWLGPRPDEPQLPMYAVAAGADVRVIAFAKLKPGEQAFCGLAMEDGLLPGVTTIDRNRSRDAARYAGWTQLLHAWRAEAEALGTAFREGDARAAPKRGEATCQQCDQQPLCRIAEKAGEP